MRSPQGIGEKRKTVDLLVLRSTLAKFPPTATPDSLVAGLKARSCTSAHHLQIFTVIQQSSCISTRHVAVSLYSHTIHSNVTVDGYGPSAFSVVFHGVPGCVSCSLEGVHTGHKAAEPRPRRQRGEESRSLRVNPAVTATKKEHLRHF